MLTRPERNAPTFHILAVSAEPFFSQMRGRAMACDVDAGHNACMPTCRVEDCELDAFVHLDVW